MAPINLYHSSESNLRVHAELQTLASFSNDPQGQASLSASHSLSYTVASATIYKNGVVMMLDLKTKRNLSIYSTLCWE